MNKIIKKAYELECSSKWAESKKLLEDHVGQFHGIEKINAIFQIGKIYKYTGDFKKAEQKFIEAIDCSERNNIIDLVDEISLQQAIVWQCLGKYPNAKERLTFLLDSSGNDYIYSHCLMQLGIMNRIFGNLSQSESQFIECGKIKRRLFSPRDEAVVAEQLGIIDEKRGDLLAAIEHYNDSLRLKKIAKYERGIATYYLRMGVNKMKSNSFSQAKLFLLKSLEIREKVGDMIGIASSYHNIGKLHYKLEDMDISKIINLVLKSLKIRATQNDFRRETNSLCLLSLLEFNNNNYDEAFCCFNKAKFNLEEMGLKLQLVGFIQSVLHKLNEKDKNNLLPELRILVGDLNKEQIMYVDSYKFL